MGKVAYIDDKPYEMIDSETILFFIQRIKGENSVPTLCDAPNLKPFGSCRVCNVDVALSKGGPVKALASCHSPLSENMYIYPNSERIEKLRKNILELVLTDYPMERLPSSSNGKKGNGKSNGLNSNNELHNLVERYGLNADSVRYPAGKNNLDLTMDKSHPYMVADLAACINCYRCVRACDEVQGQFVLSMAGRGIDTKVVVGMDTTFDDSMCVSCGACSQACPTMAITDIYRSKDTVPDSVTRTVCTYCGVGCNLDVAVKEDAITSVLAPYDAKANQGYTCLKGRYAFKFYNHPDRLQTPLIRRNGKFEKATWDEAYDVMVERFNELKKDHGPDSIAGISSARCTNEENYLMQKFIRAVIGTNNIDCCARVCHSPTALGMQRSFGTGAATNSIEDIHHTDCMLIIGANPTTAHPVTGAKIKQASMQGKKLIIVDPKRIELANYADIHLQLRPGTNVAMLNMLLHYIVIEKLVNQNFIDERCEGYSDFKDNILKLDIDEMERVTGVKKELAREAAIMYASAPNAMSFHGLGVTEHTQGTFTVMLIADLAMVTGNIGRQGVGVNPLRGQNNVQGAADMGAQPHQGAGYLDITDPEIHNKYEAFYGRSISEEIGWKIPEMFNAAIDNQLKALWIIGEDVVQTDPNTNHVKKAMESLEFLVVQELFMTETAQFADVILPATSFLEKSGTFTNGERRVQRVNAVIEPLEGTKQDGQIIVDVMNRMGYNQPDYHPKTALEEISQIVPFFKGIKWDELGENGKQWPVAEDGKSTEIIHVDNFKRGKGNIQFIAWRESNEIVENAKDYPYILTTGRELEHYNCGTMTRRTPNNDLLGEDTLLVNPNDAANKNISDGDLVCISSARGKVDLKAKLTTDVKPGILYTTFHFPEILVNVITGSECDTEALCPEYKVVAVDIRKAKNAESRKVGVLV